MDESRRKAMRRAHAKRAHYCTCGAVVHGNGGEHSHKSMHIRRSDWKTAKSGGHYYMTYSAYQRRQADTSATQQ